MSSVSNRGSVPSGTSKPTRIRWWQVWRYGELKQQNERDLAQLVRHGPLTASDAQFFMALCKGGRRTPPWLADKLMASADRARDVGEERASGL